MAKEKKAVEKQQGITVKKQDDFSEWYQQIILKSELADYTLVSGCIVFRPRSYQLWEKVKEVVDAEFKKIKIQNTYFPLFIPESLLSKEAEHVKGFSPEVAWVTHSGSSKLNERLAVRPTSETIMYDSYSKWIRGHRDLPLRYNQWNNVVRWEFKHPVPFLRSREFLWNEGHHAYATYEELLEDKEKILDIYSKFCRNYMALEGMIGKKTEKEKFAGAVATYTLEYVLSNGKAIQGPDYHDDGQNFAKAYDIKFLNEKGETGYVYQSTYALSTRMIGVMIAVHSDDKGAIIPPMMANQKAVIIPILFDKTKKEVLEKAEEIKNELKEINAFVDSREEYTPGWKYNEWELKGVPLRIEIGPKDVEKNQIVVVRRDTGKKEFVKIDNVKKEIPHILENMQKDMYNNAKKLIDESKKETNNFDEMIRFIEDKKIVKVPHCNEPECEDIIKEKVNGAKTLNSPLNDKPEKGTKCIHCDKEAKIYVYFGKSY